MIHINLKASDVEFGNGDSLFIPDVLTLLQSKKHLS